MFPVELHVPAPYARPLWPLWAKIYFKNRTFRELIKIWFRASILARKPATSSIELFFAFFKSARTWPSTTSLSYILRRKIRSCAVSLDNTSFKTGYNLYYNQRPSIQRTTALQKAALDKPQRRHIRRVICFFQRRLDSFSFLPFFPVFDFSIVVSASAFRVANKTLQVCIAASAAWACSICSMICCYSILLKVLQ